MDGSGSTWNNGYGLYIGYSGTGTLNITNGGGVTDSSGYLGYSSASKGVATVDGIGSMWTNSAPLYVGYVSMGTLNITNGGAVSNTDCYLGLTSGSTAVVTVDGTGSTWINTGKLSVGYSGSGTLNVSNGGTVCANTITGGSVSTGVMSLNFDGGILKPYNASNAAWIITGSGSGNVYIEEGCAQFDTSGYNMGIGLPLQHGGSNPIDGGVTKLGAGTLTLTGANTYTGLTTVKAGTLELGPSAQSPVLTGAGANILAGSLAFDYTGSSPASAIQSLLATSYNGGVSSWTTGQFLTSGSTSAGIPVTLGWIDNGSNVTVMATIAGDTNCDGSVNSTDLNTLIGNYGTGTTWAQGDFQYTGTTDSPT